MRWTSGKNTRRMLSSLKPSLSSENAATSLTSATLLSDFNRSVCISVFRLLARDFGRYHQPAYLACVIWEKEPPKTPMSECKRPGRVLAPLDTLLRFRKHIALIIIAGIDDLARKCLPEI